MMFWKKKNKKTASEFADVVQKGPFCFCSDENYQYIIRSGTGEVIYKKEYKPYSKSDFCYCGNTEKGPVFWDARYSTYLYPEDGEYKVYKDLYNGSVVVNGNNVLNITENENGVGAVDSFGNEILKNQYDSVTVELKVCGYIGNKKEEKIIPLFKDEFKQGVVCQMKEWL